jgi:endoglucanase
MIRNKKLQVLILLLCFLTLPLISQAPFSRGVNLTGWFQSSGPKSIQFTKFTKTDIANIKSLGCDVIRLPINMHMMTAGAPSYTLDPLYFQFLDSAVTWCEQLKIYVILDNHSFDPSGSTTPGIEDVLTKVWQQMATHYRNRSEYVLYEILNEPYGMTTAVWGAIQGRIISVIRAFDTKHTLVVGGSSYNTYTELKNLPVYSDNNLLYTFHFYDPFVFTHQGATWPSPSLGPLSGVPFPYDAAKMPACPSSLVGTWIQSGLNSYPSQGNAAYMKQLIDNAISFRTSRHANIFCGEFGVYNLNSANADRCAWYSVVRKYLNDNNVPWTIWDYKGGFGIFNKGSGQMFDHDLNTRMLDSLDFNVPPQTSFTIKPDSTGFLIYMDYDAAGIEDESSSAGTVDFYNSDLPEAGNYCISWKGFSQYNKLGFNFVPDKDLSRLKTGCYALDLMVRGDASGIKFDIRFIDTKTDDPNDHPWRMRYVIDGSSVPWDRKWHHIHVPLSSFTEHGSWDNNAWYVPQGKFDWTKVDNLEISTEYTDIIGKQVWFDNIIITDRDTAAVRETGALGIDDLVSGKSAGIAVSPNPMKDHAKITFVTESENKVKVNIFSVTGTVIKSLYEGMSIPGLNYVEWNGQTDYGTEASPGIYFCQVVDGRYTRTTRILKF